MSEHEIPDNDEVQAAAFGELQSQPAAASASSMPRRVRRTSI